MTLLPSLYPCRSCARDTEWDRALTTEPVCVTCFDAVLDAEKIDADNKRFMARGRQ